MQTTLTSMFSTLTVAADGQIRPIIDIYASEHCSKETTVPLWKVYHPVGAYTKEDEQAFSKRITDIYSQVPVPKFYVDVVFQEIPEDAFYVGGEPVRNFVRIHMDHIARQLTSDAA